jgi:glucose/mannose transport system permease protein
MSVIDRLGSLLGPSEAARSSERGILDRDFVRSMPFWLPTTFLMVLFVYGGIVWNFLISLIGWSGIAQPSYTLGNFGIESYTRMLGDPTFWSAARNTVVLVVVFTALSLILGLVLAVLVDNLLARQGLYRTVFLLPFALSFVVTGLIWMWMYDSDTGLINVVLGSVGLDALALTWLGNPDIKLFAVIIAMTWQFSGYAMVVLLAGLRTIPQAHYDAAKTDGAGFFTMYRRVIIPQLSSAAVSISVILMVFALAAFAWLFVVFGRNPGPSADILGVMMYRQAFAANQWSYGAALGTVMFVMMSLIVAPYLYRQYRKGDL